MNVSSFIFGRTGNHKGNGNAMSALLVLFLLAGLVQAQGQYSYSTNADGSVYTYSTNADGTAAIGGYSGPPWDVTIPTNIAGRTVTSIGDKAFWVQGNLTRVTLPGTITSIGEEAFEFCGNLTNVTIPASVSEIEGEAFNDTRLTSVTLSDSITSINDGTFGNCFFLTNVTIPSSVTNMQPNAFAGAGLTSVAIPGTVAGIGSFAFADCTNLTNVIIASGVTGIEADMFAGCSRLVSVTLPASIANIREEAFWDCSNLTSITIPGSVTNLEGSAFTGCSNLARVYFVGNAPITDSSVFANLDYYGNIIGYENVTVFHLPGATGWSNTLAGVPALLWNPVIQMGNGMFGVRKGQFGFEIAGTAGIPIVVEGCADLGNPVWTALTNVTVASGLFHFSEPLQGNTPGRYYRIRSP